MEMIASMLVFGLVMLGMSLGVIFAGKTIKKSCGGSSNCDVDEGKIPSCDFCENPEEEKRVCERRKRRVKEAQSRMLKPF